MKVPGGGDRGQAETKLHLSWKSLRVHVTHSPEFTDEKTEAQSEMFITQ